MVFSGFFHHDITENKNTVFLLDISYELMFDGMISIVVAQTSREQTLIDWITYKATETRPRCS
jgi:hypothetical protein